MANKRNPRIPRVAMISLGCAKNTVDAEIMLGELLGADFALAADPRLADVILVNTCGFIQDARDEADEVLGDLLADRRIRGRVVAVGCLAERDAAGLRRTHPKLSAAWGFAARGKLAERLRALLAAAADDETAETAATGAGAGDMAAVYDGPRLLSTPPSYAYLRLSDGCDNRCSYCAIPLIRGPYRERSRDAVLDEARTLVDGGVPELILIAQDTTRYRGSDGAESLADLLALLLRRTAAARIRLLYAHPAHLDDATIDLLLNEPRLCGYLDLPLQHIDDAVLARMNRPYGRRRIDAILERLGPERLRRAGGAGGDGKPGFALRTTFLTGFPGETAAAFEELRAFVAAGWFTHLGAFAYSPEAGTPASAFADAVPGAVARERRDALMAAQQPVAFARLDARLGGVEEVLIDGMIGPGYWRARSVGEAPDSDPAVIVTASERESKSFATGAPVKVGPTRREGYDLLARPAVRRRRR